MTVDKKDKLLRLEFCQKIRNIAAQTCLRVFQQIVYSPHKVSESKFRNTWLKELERSYPKGYIDCWYDPPPDGIAALFGDEKNFERVNYPNLRPEIYWPKPNVYFKPGGLGYIFASPYTMVDNIPIIGDFGFSYYLGKSEKIKDHFKKCWNTLNTLIEKIEVGMMFKDIHATSIGIIKHNKLENYIKGTTDKAGTDLGHTIPFIEGDPKLYEENDINSGDHQKINQVISKTRVFINEFENYFISANCAFTFEPRFVSFTDELPMCSFHTIVQFVDKKKIILTNFKGIFNLLGMEWLMT